MLKLKNTKSRKIEEFKPLSSREVKVYFCGPTVYNYAHIWNLRSFVFEDIVIKTLKFLGYNVKTTMNLTDIDDKTIRDSQKEGENLKTFTEKYTKIFLEDLEKLSIQKADNITPISQIIPEMVRMIQTMLNRKNAYLSEDGSIYFDVKTSKNYGKFANLDMENLKAWARVDADEYEKDSVSDFVLWKAWKESDWENFWEEEFEIPPSNSPLWKEGEPKKIKLKWRPGWHIECSACAMKHFWAQIDIHMWWVDLIFPHHQNEIAQTEACTRKTFAKYWLHSGHLTVDSKKMAKSANNFYTIKDLEEKYNTSPQPSPQGEGVTSPTLGGGTKGGVLYRALRLSLMWAKYSTQVDFSFKKLESNFSVIKGIDELLKNLKRELEFAEEKVVSRDFSETLQDYLQAYIENLEDDFNIPEALAVFHNFTKFLNTGLREKLFSKSEIEASLDLLKTFNEVLWVIDFSVLEEKEEKIEDEVLTLFDERNKAKTEKNFEKADKLRDEILKKWYKIIDNREWSFLEKI